MLGGREFLTPLSVDRLLWVIAGMTPRREVLLNCAGGWLGWKNRVALFDVVASPLNRQPRYGKLAASKVVVGIGEN